MSIQHIPLSEYKFRQTLMRYVDIGDIMRLGNYHDRFDWMLIDDKYLVKYIAMRRWVSRYISWWRSEYGKDPLEWTLPNYEETGDVDKPVALKIESTRDGETHDQLYLGLNIEPSYAWHARWDVYVPSKSQLPSKSPAFGFGFETIGEGGTNLVSVQWLRNYQVKIVARFRDEKMIIRYAASDDISATVSWGAWNEFHFIWDPPFAVLYNETTDSLTTYLYPYQMPTFPHIIPCIYIEPPAGVVIKGFKLKWWSAWRIDRVTRTYELPQSGSSTLMRGASIDSGSLSSDKTVSYTHLTLPTTERV